MKLLATDQIIAIALEARHVARAMPRDATHVRVTVARTSLHEAHAVVAQLGADAFVRTEVAP